MTRRSRLSLALLPLTVSVSLWTPAAETAGDARLVILQPGYPGSTEQAKEFVSGLCTALRDLGGPALTGGAYYNNLKQGQEAVRRDQPAVGILSLGVYLKHAEEWGLEPLLWSRPEGPFHVLVRKGFFKKLEDLEGKSVTGTPLLEIEFVDRVLFGGKEGARLEARRNWQVRPTQRFSKGIRSVRRGGIDAVLLTDLEYKGFKTLETSDELEVIHTTAALPTAVIAAFGDRLSPQEKDQLAKALAQFPNSPSGKKLLKTMGIDGFVAVDTNRLNSLLAEYRRGGSAGPSGTE